MTTALQSLRDGAWDSATCVSLVLGSTRVSFTKFAIPKLEVKTEKIAPIGAGIATRRTPGKAEVAAVNAEMLLRDYTEQILPHMNKHGGTLTEFNVVARVGHPSIEGSFNALLDVCRVLSWEGPEFDGSEKALVMKLIIDPMFVFHKSGATGLWKCLHYDAAKPSSQAKALMRY